MEKQETSNEQLDARYMFDIMGDFTQDFKKLGFGEKIVGMEESVAVWSETAAKRQAGWRVADDIPEVCGYEELLVQLVLFRHLISSGLNAN